MDKNTESQHRDEYRNCPRMECVMYLAWQQQMLRMLAELVELDVHRPTSCL